MKKSFLSLLTILFINGYVYSSNYGLDTATLFKVVPYKNLIFYGSNDQKIIEIKFSFDYDKTYSFTNKKTRIFLDSILADSVYDQLFIKRIFIHDEPRLLVQLDSVEEGQGQTYKLIDLRNGKVEEIISNSYVFTYFDNRFITGEFKTPKYYEGYGAYVPELFSYEIATSKVKPFHQFANDPEKAEGVTNIFASKNGILILFRSCYLSFVECDNPKIYYFENRTKEIFFLREEEFQPLNYFPIYNDNMFFFNLSSGAPEIRDEKLEIVSLALKRNLSLIGWNYKGNTLSSFNFKSSLDSKDAPWKRSYKEVIIPYRFRLGLESALYNIFNDMKLLVPDLDSSDLYDLLISKNLIFAKHNYKFDSEYYQAFFNLFPWYNSVEKRQTRTKEVNHLLTDADKENLKIINKELKKYEK